MTVSSGSVIIKKDNSNMIGEMTMFQKLEVLLIF